MSLLLRHPGCVPSLFSRGVEAEDAARASFEPLRALSRHVLPFRTLSVRLRTTPRKRSRERRPGSSPAAVAMMVVTELPLLKAAAALLSLSLLH